MGADIGTSYSKGVVTTLEGTIVARTDRAHDVSMPRAGWAEHEADGGWWSELCSTTRELAGAVGRGRIRALGVNGLGPSFVPLDAADSPQRACHSLAARAREA